MYVTGKILKICLISTTYLQTEKTLNLFLTTFPRGINFCNSFGNLQQSKQRACYQPPTQLLDIRKNLCIKSINTIKRTTATSVSRESWYSYARRVVSPDEWARGNSSQASSPKVALAHAEPCKLHVPAKRPRQNQQKKSTNLECEANTLVTHPSHALGHVGERSTCMETLFAMRRTSALALHLSTESWVGRLLVLQVVHISRGVHGFICLWSRQNRLYAPAFSRNDTSGTSRGARTLHGKCMHRPSGALIASQPEPPCTATYISHAKIKQRTPSPFEYRKTHATLWQNEDHSRPNQQTYCD